MSIMQKSWMDRLLTFLSFGTEIATCRPGITCFAKYYQLDAKNVLVSPSNANDAWPD